MSQQFVEDLVADFERHQQFYDEYQQKIVHVADSNIHPEDQERYHIH